MPATSYRHGDAVLTSNLYCLVIERDVVDGFTFGGETGLSISVLDAFDT